MKISLFELFMVFFKINSITFGGGYTIVPVVSDEFVNKRKLISEDDMFNLVAIAQSGPGAMAISTSLLTGYKLLGISGAITALIASVLPCIIILSIISIFYIQFNTNFFIRSALDGISGVICAVLFFTVYNLLKNATKKYKYFTWIIVIAVLILDLVFDVATQYLILGSAFFAIIVFYFRKGDVK